MGRRTLPSLLLVCVLVLAGCSGLSGQGADGDAGIEGDGTGAGVSVTPAPVPTVGRTEPSSSGLPPGFTSQGVTDVDALFAAHRSALDNTTYSVRAVVNATHPNGTNYYRSAARARVTERDDGYYYSSRFDHPNRSTNTLVRYESWSGGGTILTALTRRERATSGGNATADGEAAASRNTTYRAIRSEYETNTGLYGLPRYGERIAAQLGAAESSLRDRTDTAGPAYYALSLGSVRDLQGLADGRFRDPQAASGRILVSPQGFVREYRLRYTATTPKGHTVRVTESITYSAVGRTTVTRPPWYETAIERTNVTVDETQ
jgi:predicted small secreted protein